MYVFNVTAYKNKLKHICW